MPQASNKKQSRSSQKSDAYDGALQAGDALLAPFISMQKQMSALMEETMRSFSQVPDMMAAGLQKSSPFEKIMPKVDVHEDEQAFYLETTVPNVDAEDVDISINDRYMTIRCNAKTSQNSDDGSVFYGVQDICRTVMIPDNANSGDAEAEIKDGHLRVTVPKKKTAEKDTRHLKIKKAA